MKRLEALGRTKQWEQENVCAPCLYKTEGEPSLKFSFLAAMDGNNSLKLVDSAFRSGKPRWDDRESDSVRWIVPEDVDVFKDEVSRTVCRKYRFCVLLIVVVMFLTGATSFLKPNLSAEHFNAP